MKSILLAGITVVMITLSTAVLADKAHHGDQDEGAKQSMSGMMHSGSMGMMDMEAMHKQMTKMQKTMKKIHNSKDSKVRQELMRQHMQEMHKGMTMMQGMMSAGKMKKPMAMMDTDDEMADLKTMHKHYKMMEQRMDMMQGMMGQMMEHMMQRQGIGMEKK